MTGADTLLVRTRMASAFGTRRISSASLAAASCSTVTSARAASTARPAAWMLPRIRTCAMAMLPSVGAARRGRRQRRPHLADDLLRLGGHQPRVRRDGDELEAFGDHAQRVFRRAVVDPGNHAMRLGTRQDVVDRVD